MPLYKKFSSHYNIVHFINELFPKASFYDRL